jgi:hypothetical protein
LRKYCIRKAHKAILEAKGDKLLPYLGISQHGYNHQAPLAFTKALRRFPFDAVMWHLTQGSAFRLSPRCSGTADALPGEAEELCGRAES